MLKKAITYASGHPVKALATTVSVGGVLLMLLVSTIALWSTYTTHQAIWAEDTVQHIAADVSQSTKVADLSHGQLRSCGGRKALAPLGTGTYICVPVRDAIRMQGFRRGFRVAFKGLENGELILPPGAKGCSDDGN
ncbi:hypothetical protein [Nocardioides sp. InS609-2]|uniref:hypothetical protein n=1 Tax=Nocardioides sp. InS609-2 TaxID=2760705 RepID=UPI0020BF82C4|nr:hypothetical protein [Nocardioides sp. InS609-2]